MCSSDLSYSDAYTVRVDGDRDGFIDYLKERGCKVEEGGRQHLDVTLPEDTTSALILTAADSTGVQLRKMVSSIQTLEDVFIKTIGENKNAGL